MEKIDGKNLNKVTGGFSYSYEKGKWGENENLTLSEKERQILRSRGCEFNLFEEDDWNEGEIKAVMLNGKELTPKKIAEMLSNNGARG